MDAGHHAGPLHMWEPLSTMTPTMGSMAGGTSAEVVNPAGTAWAVSALVLAFVALAVIVWKLLAYATPRARLFGLLVGFGHLFAGLGRATADTSDTAEIVLGTLPFVYQAPITVVVFAWLLDRFGFGIRRPLIPHRTDATNGPRRRRLGNRPTD